MSSGSTNTVSEQLHGIQFTNEDFNQLRKALEDQQKKTEGPLLFNNGRLGTTWGNWLEAYQPNYMKDQAERSYEQSIELQHKLIQLKRLVSQTIPKPEETVESEECNCFICFLRRMVKKNGGVGIEVVVSKNGIEVPQDAPMTRDEPKGSHTES